MKFEKTDRRVQRTRLLLKDALMSLIAEKGYEAITIQNLIDKANLGRSTFYSHFTDKEHLLISSMDEVVHSLIHGMDGNDANEETEKNPERILWALPIFALAKEQYGFHKALVTGVGTDVIRKSILQHLSSHIEERFLSMVKMKTGMTVPVSVVSNFLAGSLLSLLIWWLEHNMPHSPEEMDRMYQTLTMPGVMKELGIQV